MNYISILIDKLSLIHYSLPTSWFINLKLLYSLQINSIRIILSDNSKCYTYKKMLLQPGYKIVVLIIVISSPSNLINKYILLNIADTQLKTKVLTLTNQAM